MKQHRKVDKSFIERLGILRLLEGLRKENITFAEMDEIGGQLRKAGRRAALPLVRKLWREKNGTLISKYTYLLDFLDDRYWIDQLIQIALRRRDLEEEGKAALLAALEGCGIDVASPPFARLLTDVNGPLGHNLPKMLDRGDDGLLWFMEDFAYAPKEMQLALVRELPRIADPRVVTVLSLLLHFDDPEVAAETVTALGQVREPAAACRLTLFRREAPASLHPRIDRSLRRLAFLRIPGPDPDFAPVPHTFHSAFVSPVDGAGFRLLWLARHEAPDRLATIYLQLHDATGIRGVWGGSDVPVTEYEEQLPAQVEDEEVVPIPPEHALELLRDAMFTGRQQNMVPPPEFYVRRAMFTGSELDPSPYVPAGASRHDAMTPGRLTAAAELFDDDFFSGWYLATGMVYDLAEQWIALETAAGPGKAARGLEGIIETFCSELLGPQLDRIARRLLLNADLMERCGRDPEQVSTAFAVAANLQDFRLPLHFHPFLRRFAMESLIAAREALAEGYDLREHPEDSDDDWE